MSNVWLITGLEAILMLIVIGSLAFVNWRKKQQRNTEFDQLLDDVTDQQQPRRNKLTKRFMDKFGVDQSKAIDLSEQMLTAEKVFLQFFIAQQMQQQSVAGFYENLCQLLDSYLVAHPTAIAGTSDDEPFSAATPAVADDAIADQATPETATEAVIDPLEPTASSEEDTDIADDMILADEPMLADTEADNPEEPSPEEEPPDWGDVFD